MTSCFNAQKLWANKPNGMKKNKTDVLTKISVTTDCFNITANVRLHCILLTNKRKDKRKKNEKEENKAICFQAHEKSHLTVLF